jgi:hypothetical protein
MFKAKQRKWILNELVHSLPPKDQPSISQVQYGLTHYSKQMIRRVPLVSVRRLNPDQL